MLYYATASGPKAVDAMRRGLLGQMLQPNVGNRLLDGVRWAADNGCFGDQWSHVKWGRWLLRQPRTADWATVPDVVGDHAATLERWNRFAPWVRRIGFKPAFVAQDGCTPDRIPADAAALFVGGTDAFKTSNVAHACVLEAQRRGIPTHMGRVNSLRRIRIAAQWGVDSVDGTFLAFGPDQNLPKLLRWLDPYQPGLFGGVA